MPRVYSEALGAWVEVPEEPGRIVSLAPSITETLYLLGVWDRVVAVSYFCNKPPEAREKPRVGAYLNVDYRALERLKPDLVLTTTGAQLRLTRELHEKGYTVYPVPLPVSVWGVLENVEAVGGLVGRRGAARRLAESLAARLAGLAARASGGPLARVLYEVDLGEPYTVGGFSYIDSALEHIGLENVFGERGASYFQAKADEILEADPDIVVFEAKPFSRYSIESVKRLYEKRGLGSLRALREGKLIVLAPDSLAHYGPSLVDAMERLRGYAEELARGGGGPIVEEPQ